ncbi:oxygenase MpaB family protein [soil metagenome]
MGIGEVLRRRIISSATSPFGHAEYPLANSFDYRGDTGLFGPGAVSWRVLGDVSAFIGGIRALLVQAAHPEVVAGVADHSRYREDPLGRLSRTSAYVTATTYGAMPEVDQAVATVRRAHLRVRGVSHRGVGYTADDPGFSAWVHNALTDSFLAAYETFGPGPLTTEEADRFVEEQAAIGRLLDADPLPLTASALTGWVTDHPRLGASPGMVETVDFVVAPPLEGPGLRAGYFIMEAAAVATLPARLGEILGVAPKVGATAAGRALIGSLRWALGASPSWQLALIRSGAAVPPGLFRQPLRVDPSGAPR